MKKLLFISLAAILALSVGLVGCSSPTNYTLTIASTSGGSVFPAAGDHAYASGQVVDIKATPASDSYNFVNWTGDVGTIADVNAAATKITMNGDYSIKANFESQPWDSTITLSAHFTISERASVVEAVYAPWMAAVQALTGSEGGKFKIEATYGDSPFDDVGSLWGISSGVVDIGQLNPDTFKIGHIGYLPWFFPSMEATAYVTYKIFADPTWDKKGDLSQVKVLLTSPLWPAEYWGTTNVKVPADLVGVKVRAEYAEVDGISALGATPVNIGTSDLANSIMSHTVDGCFFTWSGIGGFVGLGEATQYTTQVDMFYRPYVLAMNKASWDALPAEAQEKLATLCGAAKSVEFTKAHDAAQADTRQEVIDGPKDFSTTPPTMHPEWGRPIYVPTAAELGLWKTATAGVKGKWETYLNNLNDSEFPTWGTDLLTRAQQLIAEYNALP